MNNRHLDAKRAYRTIVVDPPWHYEKTPKGRPGWRKGDNTILEPNLPYPSMTVDEIKALPIPDLAAPDAWLWLWTTNRYLPKAFSVLGAWGFTYKQTLLWTKTGGSHLPAAIAPNHAEFLLYATQGGLTRTATLPSNVIVAPRQNQHSRKPEMFLDLIESVSPSPYLELFARRNRIGWDTWGNESLEHVAI